ncbi:MAG: hypothetical protein A2Y93_10695 [Chloroflexi bacterium RBG_13_68_17]|nr:MAG: hypothetical protein A2Y93_10695 [Chloroflexi bacterium RBG_13_68_17]
MTGKRIRMQRLIQRGTGRSLILPFDHGYFLGLIEGSADFRGLVRLAADSRADAILITRGIARATADVFGGVKGLILRISGMTALSPHADHEVVVTSVESALALGADAVAVTVFLGSEHEQDMLRGLGRVADACDRLGIPLLGEVMFSPRLAEKAFQAEYVAWAARLGQEAGADILKLNYPGDAAGMRHVVSGCTLPIVIAGGARLDSDADVLRMASESVRGGAAGTCIGRNVFQSPDPAGLLARLAEIVHEGKAV